jgi:hypothetical protein
MVDELKVILNEVSKLSPEQRGPWTTYLVISLIRDLAYYVVAGIVAFGLGRRIIQAVLTAVRESRRESA